MKQSASRQWNFGTTIIPTARRGSASEDVVYKGQSGADISNILNALRSDNNYVLLTTRMRRFFESTEKILESLDQAIVAKDFDQMDDVVDQLRAETSTLGAVGMMKLCYRVQILTRTRNLPELERCVAELKKEFGIVKEGLAATFA